VAEDKMKPPSDSASLDARILFALKTAPRPQIPAGFAARVARQLPPRPAVVLTPERYGRLAAAGCLVVLLALMLVFAHRATGTSLYWSAIEWIFCAQFVLLAVWLGVRGSTFTNPFFKLD
jgi:hypothetical protein